LPTPVGGPGPVKFCRPSTVPYSHPVGPGYPNQGARPSQVPLRFSSGMQISAPRHQHMIRPRLLPSAVVHQQNRLPKKRPSFEANAGGNAQFKQVRFDATAKRKKVFLFVYSVHIFCVVIS